MESHPISISVKYLKGDRLLLGFWLFDVKSIEQVASNSIE